MTEMVIERTGYDIGAALRRAKTRPEHYQETILLEVARRISDAMEEQDISRAELARKLGVTPAYITKILRGHENFSLQTLAKIAFTLEKKWAMRLIDKDRAIRAIRCPAKEGSQYAAHVAESAD